MLFHLPDLPICEFDESLIDLQAQIVGDSETQINVDEEDNYSPYCKVCNACGEEGYCMPTFCQQSPDGKYCESYLLDLKFGYLMFLELHELIYKDPIYEKELKTIYNRVYDEIYK
jgi:hypothetical protein